MRETILNFGPAGGLLGIVSEPETSPAEDQPILVILNAGVVNRVGPYRLNVELGRSLAEAGFRSVRMDLSSMGDSLVRTDVEDVSETSQRDLADLFTR